jgi:flavin-binding protein dodecin
VAGAVAGWGSHPLESAALHGPHPKRTLTPLEYEAGGHILFSRRLLIQINGQDGAEYPASCIHTEWENDMPESVYDVILLIGSSKESWEKAAANAVEQASKSLRNLRVAEIVELDMQLDAKGKVEAYRAKVKLSFKVER